MIKPMKVPMKVLADTKTLLYRSRLGDIARGRIRPRQTSAGIRNFSTNLRNDTRQRLCARDCCCCASDTQRRKYNTMLLADSPYRTLWSQHIFDPSSLLPLQQRRNKSNFKTTDENANEPNASMAVAEEEERSDEPAIPGAQKGGRKLAIVFTCTVCDTRSVKQFTENAYTNGVVIVQCPGCGNRHLIADNLGYFDDDEGGWNIEKAMAKMGDNVRVVNNDNVLELSVEDLYGKKIIEEAATDQKS